MTAHDVLGVAKVVALLIALSIQSVCGQTEPTGSARWEPQIAAFVEQDRLDAPPMGEVLFVGSSSIRGWDLNRSFPELMAINRGFGGSQIEDSVYYAERIILPYRPQIVVIYAGDNDINAGKSAERVCADYQKLATTIRQALPDTTIVYISIKPSLRRWGLIDKMREANRRIRDVAAADEKLVFVDVDGPMMDADGRPRKELFVDDGLHLNAEGYRLWSDLVRPHLTSATRDWPQFRGPLGNGHAPGLELALRWSETENVAWKTPIHGRGWSSPVVLGDEIWITTATDDGKELFAVCVDLASGHILHDVKVFDVESPQEIHALNSHASPTPVIEGGRVYVHFGSYGTACLDTKSARTLWSRRDLPCNHWRGPGSSPLLYDGMLINHYDGYDYQYVAALDKTDGTTIWKVDRDIDYGTDDGDLMKAFCTPIVIEAEGRRQLISPAAKATLAYDPYTGRELWRIRYSEHSATARPLFDQGLLFINTGFGNAQLLAVRPDGAGDVTDSHVLWTVKKGIGSKPSHVLVDDLIYVVHDRGTLTCLDERTGEEVWTTRLGGSYSASPIYADGRIYLMSQEGKTTVINPGRKLEILAENTLDEGFMASPAAVGRSLILRTRTHLYRIVP
jgi:outer membrane protein assembly factor BamB/lysophospholipase L1-like esterase